MKVHRLHISKLVWYGGGAPRFAFVRGQTMFGEANVSTSYFCAVHDTVVVFFVSLSSTCLQMRSRSVSLSFRWKNFTAN
jgi:hypothetical protein